MFRKLNPLLHSELRLAIMSLLMELEEADFSYIKEKTGASSGNLSIQADKLAEAGYLEVEKGFNGRKPRTVYRVTPLGAEMFSEYVEALKSYFKIPGDISGHSR